MLIGNLQLESYMKNQKTKTDLVVKSNNLVSAVYSLSLTESRIVQMAMVAGREQSSEVCLDDRTPVKLYASEYADTFGTTLDAALVALSRAQENLFTREFTITTGQGNKRISRWIQDYSVLQGEGAVELTFTRTVCGEITRLMDNFTQYRLAETSNLNTSYGLRLYELLASWIRTGAMYAELEQFRDWMGLDKSKYKHMHQLKARVLDSAIDDINDNSPMTVGYTQRKAGRRIIGFDFNFSIKIAPAIEADAPKKPKKKTPEAYGDEVIQHLNMTRDAVSAMASKMSFLPDDQLPAELVKLPPPKRANQMLHTLSNPETWQLLLPQLKAVDYKTLID